MLSKDILGIYEAYSKMYQPTNPPEGVVEEEIDGLVEEVIQELFEECIEEGYTIDEAAVAIEEAATEYFDEAKITYGSDTESPEQRRARAQAKVGEKRSAARKAAVKGAVERVKAKAKGAKAAAGIAGSIAKDEARRAGRAAKQAVVGAVEKKKKEVKSGIKGFLGKAAKKVASKASSVAARLGEEASGLFSEQELAAFASVEEGYKEIDAKKHGRMYDRYKKLRTAAMKDAEESGEASGENRKKMGQMQGVISKSAENLRNKG